MKAYEWFTQDDHTQANIYTGILIDERDPDRRWIVVRNIPAHLYPLIVHKMVEYVEPRQ